MEQIRQIFFGTTPTRRKNTGRGVVLPSFLVYDRKGKNKNNKNKFNHKQNLPKTSISDAIQYAKVHTKQAQCSERTYIIADFFHERIRSKERRTTDDEEIEDGFDSSAILSSARTGTTTSFGGYDRFGDHMCLEFRVKKKKTTSKDGFASMTIHFTRTLVGGWELSGSGSRSSSSSGSGSGSGSSSGSNDAPSRQKGVTITANIEEGFAAKDGTAYWYQTTEDNDDDGGAALMIQPTVVFGTFMYDETISSFVFHGEYQSLPLKNNFGKVEMVATTMVASKNDDDISDEEDASSSSSSVGTSQTSLTPSVEDDDDFGHINEEDHDDYHDDGGNHVNTSTATATTTDRIEKHVRFRSKEETFYVERYLIPESEEEEDKTIIKKKQQPEKKSKKDKKTKKAKKKGSEVAVASKKKKKQKKCQDAKKETDSTSDSSMKSSNSDLQDTTIKKRKKKKETKSKKEEKTIQNMEAKKKAKTKKMKKKTSPSSNKER